MTDPVISPDGKWMWTGDEWIPAPPDNDKKDIGKPVSSSDNRNPEGKYPESLDMIAMFIFIFGLFLFFDEKGDTRRSYYEWRFETNCDNDQFSLFGLTEFCEGHQLDSTIYLIILVLMGIFVLIRAPMFNFLDFKRNNESYHNYQKEFDNFCDKVRKKANKDQDLLNHLNGLIGNGLDNFSPNFVNVVNKIDAILSRMPKTFIEKFRQTEYFLKYQKILSKPSRLNEVQRRAYFVLINEILKFAD